MIDKGLESKRAFKKNDAQMKNTFLNFDLYGKPISLTFQGRDKYRTPVGATITLLVSVFLIGFGIIRWLSA